MAAMTDYLKEKIGDHVLRNTAYTSPTTVYLALFTTATTDAGGGTEVTGGSYARQAITFSKTFSSPNWYFEQSALVTFAGLPQATVRNVAIMDALTTGNMLFHGALPTARSVLAGGELNFRLTAPLSIIFD